jgi:hypothetical protein
MSQVQTYTPLGEEIRRLRKGRGLSVDGLARKLRRHPNTIYKIEGGRLVRVSAAFIREMARELETEPGMIAVRIAPDCAVRVRAGRVREEFEARGIGDDAAVAAALGMAPALAAATLAGTGPPTAQFIATVLVTFPRCRFEDFFEITGQVPAGAAA